MGGNTFLHGTLNLLIKLDSVPTILSRIVGLDHNSQSLYDKLTCNSQIYISYFLLKFGTCYSIPKLVFIPKFTNLYLIYKYINITTVIILREDLRLGDITETVTPGYSPFSRAQLHESCYQTSLHAWP